MYAQRCVANARGPWLFAFQEKLRWAGLKAGRSETLDRSSKEFVPAKGKECSVTFIVYFCNQKLAAEGVQRRVKCRNHRWSSPAFPLSTPSES